MTNIKEIKEIVDGINIPKQLIDKSEMLVKAIFGESIKEVSGLVADQIRLRRFNNQIKIFTDAQSKIKACGLNPKNVSLKLLAPLIEYSSYEENEELQSKWSNLIANIVVADKELIFHKSCIHILNNISTDEAKLLDSLYKNVQQKLSEMYEKDLQRWNKYNTNNVGTHPSDRRYVADWIEFNLRATAEEYKIPVAEFDFSISSLINLGLLRWETEVSMDSGKSGDGEYLTDVDVYASSSEKFVFTPIGDKFIQLCNTPPEKK